MPSSPVDEGSDSPRFNSKDASGGEGRNGDGEGAEAKVVLPESDRMLLCTQVRGRECSAVLARVCGDH